LLFAFSTLSYAELHFGIINKVKKEVKTLNDGKKAPLLSGSSVSPANGNVGTVFTYTITYLDFNNDAPASGYPRVAIKKGGVTVTTVVMTSAGSGQYSNGKVYSGQYQINTAGTDYTYTYEATDVEGNVSVIVNGSGPTVNSLIIFAVTSISPISGPNGTNVTINGTGFVNGATVKIGSTSCSNTSFASSIKLTATTPTNVLGSYNVVVTNPDTSTATLTNGFTYSGGDGGGENGNIVVENVVLANKDTVGKTNNIRFDIAWDNSWFTAGAPSPTANWDAAWVFAKFSKSTDGGSSWSTWNHCTLLNTGNVAPVGSQMSFGDTGGVYKGAFIYRSSAGTGSVDWNLAELRWNYGTDAVSDTDLVQVKVFAVEMVYIPAGPFYIGDANNDNYGNFLKSDGAYVKDKVLPEYQITSENAITVGTAVDNLYYDADIGHVGDQSGPIPAGFPKGYNAFYIMKCEISQRQYCEFLNTLALTPTQFISRISNYYGSYRNYIKLASNGKYGCDANNNAGAWGSADFALMNESNDGEWVACNYISWMDVAAYTDWAALRPFTELEFEKAARGGQAAVNDEYAWGNTILESLTTSLSNACTKLEAPNQGNANLQGCSPQGPYRCGSYADAGATRTNSGAGYYGVLDLSGNLWERIVTVGNPTGRGFTGTHGDGSLISFGDATNSDWPGFVASAVTDATGSGFRGGYWDYITFDARMSARYFSADTYAFRNNAFGGRCARTSP